MRLTIFAAILVATGLTAANPLPSIEEGGDLVSPGPYYPALQKRDAFTCHGTSNATVSDCEKVVRAVRDLGEETFHLRSGICLAWHEGTCGVRFCAVHYVQFPTNRTASWVADYLTAPLVEHCVAMGANGIMGDNANINSNKGSYRLYVGQYPRQG